MALKSQVAAGCVDCFDSSQLTFVFWLEVREGRGGATYDSNNITVDMKIGHIVSAEINSERATGSGSLGVIVESDCGRIVEEEMGCGGVSCQEEES